MRILAYRKSGNLGDAIQSVAMQRLLGSSAGGYYRDIIDTCSDRLIINGWLGECAGPLADVVIAGVHVGRNHDAIFKWLAELQRLRTRIGARDPSTALMLPGSEMIGCATLTLPRYEGPREGVYAIDAPDELKAEVPRSAESWAHNIKWDMPWAEQWDTAVKRLMTLRTAEIVFTSRLHVLLPCIAMGTPVVCWQRFQSYSYMQRFSIARHLGWRDKQIRPFVCDVSELQVVYKQFLEEHDVVLRECDVAASELPRIGSEKF